MLIAALLSGVLIAYGHAQGATDQVSALTNARILQLEGQLQQALAERDVCTAQKAIALQPQIQQQQQQQRIKIEKDAGCAIDWNVSPPVCKDGAK